MALPLISRTSCGMNGQFFSTVANTQAMVLINANVLLTRYLIRSLLILWISCLRLDMTTRSLPWKFKMT